MTCVLSKTKCNTCGYCKWVENGSDLDECKDALIYTPEASRIIRVFGKAPKRQSAKETSLLFQSGQMRKRARICPKATPLESRLTLGERRLHKFLRLLDYMGTAPWANVSFSINTMILHRLTASHLHLIVGKIEFKTAPKTKLYSTICSDMDLQSCQNLVWVTNRQNGKTSTIGRFIAALAISSPVGGSLATIYSTSLDRAVELKKSALAYIQWMTGIGRNDEWGNLKIHLSNYTTFAIQQGADGAINTVVARPKNPDSCRGDAPESAWFDEIGFMSENMWYKFAFPLLQVGQRTFTCCTTPPPADSFFDVFVKGVQEANKKGDNFFYLENHSLACPECIENQEPEKCAHKLHLLPPWKSLIRFQRMKDLIPSSHAKDFATEVYGVFDNDVQYYISKKNLDGIRHLPLVHRRPELNPTDPIYVAIDPASHDKSHMGLVAMVIPLDGSKLIVGASSVPVAKCQVHECQKIVSFFLRHLRQHPFLKGTMPLIPIIECNNNEIVSRSLLKEFDEYSPIRMPFLKQNFQSCISPGIGVWLTETIKMAMIQTTYQAILDKALRFSGTLVTTGKCAYDVRSSEPNGSDQMELALTQLGHFRDQPNGKVSGVTAAGDVDDLGIALMMAVYWSFLIRSLKAE